MMTLCIAISGSEACADYIMGRQNAMFLVFHCRPAHRPPAKAFQPPYFSQCGRGRQISDVAWGIEENDDKLPLMQWRSLSRAHMRALGDISSSGLRVDISEKFNRGNYRYINDPVLLHEGDFEQPGEATATLP